MVSFFDSVRYYLLRYNELRNIFKCFYLPPLVINKIGEHLEYYSLDRIFATTFIQRWYKYHRRSYFVSIKTLYGRHLYLKIFNGYTIGDLKKLIYINDYIDKNHINNINQNNYLHKLRIIIMGQYLPDDTVISTMHLYHNVHKLEFLECIHLVCM
jgi:hypothetical protein